MVNLDSCNSVLLFLERQQPTRQRLPGIKKQNIAFFCYEQVAEELFMLGR